ncbi:MAG: lipoprotein insertase outer membrane protein LolB [Thiobacillus sp.]
MVRLAAVLLLALTTACATTSPGIPTDAVVPLSANWTLQGRIGIQAGEQSLSGQIRWQHSMETDEVLLTSPLGQGVARIVRDVDGAALEVPNQPTRRAPDAESLTREALGYTLPVAGLGWWMQARPDPDGIFEATRNGAGRLVQLKQQGWVIDYLQYAADGRPRKLTVTREGLEIRLVADSWEAD